jgi:hypothetical protein
MTVAFILFLIFAIYNKRIMIKLLLVEDDASLRYIVQGGLEDMIGGYEVIAKIRKRMNATVILL